MFVYNTTDLEKILFRKQFIFLKLCLSCGKANENSSADFRLPFSDKFITLLPKASSMRKRHAIISFILIVLFALNATGLAQTRKTQVPRYTDLEIPLFIVPRQAKQVRHAGYTASYNKNWRLPNWVAYELIRQETQGNEKRNNRFVADPLITAIIASNADYARSGYDKGHMAPAADMKWSSTAMKESFYFSNICPQHPELNRRKWKDLETKIRDWAIADSAIIIICGPVISKQPHTIGKNRITVPEKFFKVVLAPYAKPMRAIAFLFDNQRATAPLPSYVVTVDSIERLTGMDFFSLLPDGIENKIEARSDFRQWDN